MEYEEGFDFKLKKEYFTGFQVFEVAKQILGESVSINYSGSQGYSFDRCEMSWLFNEAGDQTSLNLIKPLHGEIEITVKTEFYYDWDLRFNPELKDAYFNHKSDWKVLFHQFRQAVHKPWSEWTEEEIISDPRWVFLFYQSNGMVSTAMHNSMVLGDPSNPYIKKYILLWQKLNQSQPQSLLQ